MAHMKTNDQCNELSRKEILWTIISTEGGENIMYMYTVTCIYKHISSNYQTEGNTTLKQKWSVLVNFKHSPHYIYFKE
jgi:hypothetical protein